MDEQELGVRVTALERRCVRLQAALCGALGLGAAAWLSAARAPGEPILRAQGFELVTPAGEVLGRLALDQASPVLELYHRESQASVALRAGPGPRGRAVFEELGSASLVLRSASGSARMLAGANAIPGQDQRQLVLLEGHGPSALLVTGTDRPAPSSSSGAWPGPLDGMSVLT
jgi:hypothetical protein